MALLIFVIVIIGASIAIASGIWVAFALGSAISKNNKKAASTDTNEILET
jgi:energy-converting hydrogenase Eha subunit A